MGRAGLSIRQPPPPIVQKQGQRPYGAWVTVLRMRGPMSAAPVQRRPVSSPPMVSRDLDPRVSRGMLSPATVLQLQQHAGNRAVVAAIGSSPVVMRAPVAPFRPVADFDTMTLTELDAYARTRPDWDSDTALTAERKKSLNNVLEFARAGTPQPVGPGGNLAVKELEDNKLGPRDRTKLRTYARAVVSTESAGTERKNNVADALKDGDTLGDLEAGIPKDVLHHQLGLNADGKNAFGEIVKAGKASNFARYFQAAKPNLDADNGMDVWSYLSMLVKEDHKDPVAYVGRLPHVKNYHRFHAELLDQLIKNEGVVNRRKPLLLILHSGVDHNGAFHRDVGLKDLVKNAANLTIMVEGAASLGALGGEAAKIGKRQGQGKKIQQVMLAGHGSMESIELAGKPGTSESLNVQNNKERTEKFLKQILGAMATGPDARILLNACLTAADPVTANLPADPAKARDEIKKQLNSNPNLVSTIKGMAGGRSVEGNVSSVPAGTYSEVDASGNPTGKLHGTVTDDPMATQSDRGKYIAEGTEPEGAMRAVVAHWALDEADCLKRVEERRAKPIGDWDDRVIHAFYDMVHDAPQDAAMMARLANFAARGLSEYDLEAEQKPGSIWRMKDMPEGEITKLFNLIYPFADPGAKLAMEQLWAHKVAGRRTGKPAPIFSVLTAFADLSLAMPHLAVPAFTDSLATLLPVAGAKTPTKQEMMLALYTRSLPAGKDFLVANADGKAAFAPPAGETVSSLTGGLLTDQGVLEELGLVGGSGAVPNVDLDGDGTADIYVESLTRRSMVTASWLNVREKPDATSARFESMPTGRLVTVIGQTGDWYAVEVKSRIGFSAKRYLKDRAVK